MLVIKFYDNNYSISHFSKYSHVVLCLTDLYMRVVHVLNEPRLESTALRITDFLIRLLGLCWQASIP
jgi:hypothetical protein